MSKYAVYRCYDADNQLLYVGMTTDMRQRQHEHAGQKQWYTEVAHVETEEYDSVDDAAEREMVLIAHERPRYNSPMSPRYTAHLRPETDPATHRRRLVVTLSPGALALVAALKAETGLTQSAVVELALRRLAGREGER